MSEAAAEVKSSRGARRRAAIVGAIGAIAVGATGVALLLWGEALLIASIVFSVETLGLWLGYVAFTAGWAVMGLASLAVYDRALPVVHPLLIRWWRQLWPSQRAVAAQRPGERRGAPSAITRLVMKAASVSRVLGVLVAAALIGGPGTPIWRLLGFQGASGYVCVVLSSLVFGMIWVPFYGLGGGALWRLVVG